MKNLSYFFLLLIISAYYSCTKNEMVEPAPPQPVANFEVSNSTAEIGDQIIFTNNSQNADNYEWDFGDGNISIEKNPTHSYSEAGNFSIILSASGDGGIDTSISNIIIKTPSNFPPEGYYSGETEEGGSISFSIEDDKVKNFRGSYFINVNGSVFEVSKYIPSFGTMTAVGSSFSVTNGQGKELTGEYKNNEIVGTWEHDYGTTGYSVD